MKLIDKLVRRWRISVAARYVPPGAVLLDIGSFDGSLFRFMGDRIAHGTGIEPTLDEPIITENFEVIRGAFPSFHPSGKFGVVTMLAVIEHIPRNDLEHLPVWLVDLLDTDGVVIVTMPSHAVEAILSILKTLRLIDGMAIEEHTDLSPDEVVSIFDKNRFKLICRKQFQFGLNNLLVFRRPTN